MAKHDIVTYNPTTQGFETDLGDNTAQIKGDSEKVFSVESGSTNLFSVGTSTNSITLNSHITASGNISSSLASTASFDRIVFTKITGDGSQMTNVNEIGHVSGAAQVASRISGAFNAGFVTLGDISGSVTSTGSFGKVFANTYVGDASQMTNVNEDGHFSGSAQLASNISGSFNKGFGFSGALGTETPIVTATQSIKLDESDDLLKINPIFVSGSEGDDKLYGERRFTLSMWLKFNADNGGRNTFIMAGAQSGALSGMYLWMQSNSITGEFKIKHGDTMDTANLSGIGGITIGQWYHLLLSYESNRPTPNASGSFLTALNGKQKTFEVMQSGSYITTTEPPGGGSTIGTYNGSSENTNMTVADITMWKHSIQSASSDAGIDSGSLITTLFNHGIVPNYTASFSTDYPDAYREKLKFAFNFDSSSYAGSSYSMYDRTGNTGFTLTSTDVDEGKIVSGSGDYPTEGVFYTTGSFGRLNWSGQISANASEVTNLNENGFISSSAQLSADISGSFNKGFEFENSISGSATSTGSFGRVNIDGVITGDASQVTGVSLSTNTVSGSAQLASDISGSFNKGLLYSGTISGSMESTASFFVISASTYNVTNVSHINTPLQQIEGLISQSSQIVNSSGVSRISGSFIEGFEFDGTISGSATSTGSFKRVDAVKLQGDASRIGGITQTTGLISSSAQLAADISGSFNKGFQFQNFISGSVTSTGSFTRVVAEMFQGDFSAITANDDGNLSGSSGIASDISGSFNKGFELTGLTANQLLSASFVGVSGSTFAHAGNATTMSISSLCGSDFDYRLEDGLRHGMIKGTSYGTGVWSAGPNRNDDQSGFAAVGTQNAYLAAGGYQENKDGTEKFDGTSFSFSANMSVENNALSGFGTQNAAAFMGGFGDFDGTELYNGATYSDAANMAQDRRYGGTAGTQNAGIIFGGTGASPYPNKAQTENFNGDTWTEVADLILARGLLASAGTQNSAIGAGGIISPAAKNETELWNGTSWTETANLNYARYGAAGIGTQNHFIVAGGYGTPAFSSCTEEWNGTSWAAATALSTARSSFSGGQGGLGCAGIVAGGQIGSPTATNTVELWDAPSATTASLSNFKSYTFVTNNMTVGVQTGSFSTASFNTSTNKPFIIPYVDDAYYDSRRYLHTGSGQIFSCGSCTEFSNGYNSADGQLSIGRDGILNISFQTASAADDGNGITAGVWSAGPDMITGTRGNFFGQQNASVMVSGNTEAGEGATTSHTQHYNGISWRRGADILETKAAVGGGQGYGQGEDDVGMGKSYTNGARNKHLQYGGFSWWQMPVNLVNGRNQGAAGTQNGAAIWGGATSPNTQTEEWNGHTWNVGGAMSSGKYARVGAGSQNAAIAGGGTPAPSIIVQTELYNGTTWSNGPTTPYSGNSCGAGMGGTQNNALARGNNEKGGTWDGTSWSATVDLPSARDKADVSGNSAVGMVAGGGPTPGASLTSTIEWNNSFNTGSYLLTKKIGSNYS